MKTINFFTDLFLVFVASNASAWIIRNATETLSGTNLTNNKSETGDDGLASIPKSRRKRYISQGDMIAILDYHNKVRASVFPPAANMEYMLWDEGLARSAEAWAATCFWEHGPPYLLRYLGQNLSVRTGKGNWIGEAPYRVGVPCSACPPSYGGSCSNNMCFPAVNSNFMYWFK